MVILPFFSRAQSTNEQLWFEYMLNYPFANSFNLENAFSYSTLINNSRWQAFDYSLTTEWSLGPHIDLIAQGVLSYTNQTESYNTVELRPVLGTRFYFTPNKRIQTRLLLRVEQRNFKNLDTQEWENSIRPRIRAEVIIPINQDSYFKDNLWYAIVDAEALFVDKDVEERFANRFRLRVGAGYRLNYSLRFEFIYMNQQSPFDIERVHPTRDGLRGALQDLALHVHLAQPALGVVLRAGHDRDVVDLLAGPGLDVEAEALIGILPSFAAFRRSAPRGACASAARGQRFRHFLNGLLQAPIAKDFSRDDTRSKLRAGKRRDRGSRPAVIRRPGTARSIG